MDSVSALWDSDKLDLLMDNMGLFEEEEGDTSQTDVGPCYESLEGQFLNCHIFDVASLK